MECLKKTSMISHLKKLDRTAIAEQVAGFIIAIMILNFLSVVFSRSSFFHSAEDLNSLDEAERIGDLDLDHEDLEFIAENENMENFGERWRARRAAKRKARHDKKMAKIRRKKEEGEEEGNAGSDDDNSDDNSSSDDSQDSPDSGQNFEQVESFEQLAEEELI